MKIFIEPVGNGTAPVKYRLGGWNGENVTAKEICPIYNKGKRIYDDLVAYHKDLEVWADNQEQKKGEWK